MWTDQDFENMPFIPGGEGIPDQWEIDARSYREVEHAIGRARLNIAYGPGERHGLDLFLPAGKPEGLVVFVHGGYWIRFDRTYSSHLARGAQRRGWAVAVPSYTLAPEARISEITKEVAAALRQAAGMVSGPIIVAGHSAGGHLAGRMACMDVDLPPEVAARLQRIVPISPVADLRPFLGLEMNKDFRLTPEEAENESLVTAIHRRDVPVTIWVGAEERPVFLDQAIALSQAWTGSNLRVASGCHHMDIIDGLTDPDSPLTASLFS